MAPKISIVVAVFNPGRHIEPLIASLRRQTMPPADYEVLFVDDGSDDGTPERLEALVPELPSIRVLRAGRSGGPSRPRNTGIDAAQGEYVLIVDNDDHLGDETLDRLYRFAKANKSDVVVPREVRNQRYALGTLFEHNRPDASLADDPLLSLLTPHKMFRRQFLLDHGIRFIEGPRRLEDHPFVVEAFLKADVISVLADYPCYYWRIRDDHSNAGLVPVDWPSWYGDLRDVLNVVKENVPAGPARERLLAHWYRSKVLAKLGAGFAVRSEEEGRLQFGAARKLTDEWFEEGVDAFVPGILKVRSHLLRADGFDGARALAISELGLTLRHDVSDVRVAAGAIEFDVTAWLVYADGSPVICEQRGGDWLYRLPVHVSVPDDVRDFTDEIGNARMQVQVRQRKGWVTHRLDGESVSLPADPDGTRRVGARVTARLDPEAVGAQAALDRGGWDVDVHVAGCRWSAITRLRVSNNDERLPVLLTHRLTALFQAKGGALTLDVNQRRHDALTAAMGKPRLDKDGDRLWLRIPFPGLHAEPGASMPAVVILKPPNGGRPVRLRSRLRAGSNGRPRIVARLPESDELPRGEWTLAARVGRRRSPVPAVLSVGRARTRLQPVEDAGVG